MAARKEDEVIFETPGVSDEHKDDSLRIRDILQQKHDKDNKDIVRDGVDARAAFEVFAGRVYDTPQQASVLSIADSSERIAETPVQRFLRLKQELSDLATDLDVLADSKATATHSDATNPWLILQQESHQLKQQLQALRETGAYQPFLEEGSTQSSSVEIQDLLNKLAVQTSQQSDASANVVYELYYDPSLAQGGSSTSLARIEARVRQLEEFLGPLPLAVDAERIDTNRGLFPLSDAVSNLEQRLLLLDENHIESLKQKIPLLKSELDPLNQSRAKTADARITEHASRIDALYDKMQRMEPVAVELPRVVSRMRTLESLHREAALFSQRLSRLENTFDSLSDQLSSNEAVLQEVAQSLQTNLQTLQSNITAVDERINANRS